MEILGKMFGKIPSFRGVSAAIVALILLIYAVGYCRRQIAIDACLDSGGRWDYHRDKCVEMPPDAAIVVTP